MIECVCKDKRGNPCFKIEFDDIEDNCVSGIVYRVESWSDYKSPCSRRTYLTFTIKYDGCSDINFGESLDGGYLHFCGVDEWKKHIELMAILYKRASLLINDMDNEEKFPELYDELIGDIDANTG